jgi:DNA (cytosine-5)-methyltransferase 1
MLRVEEYRAAMGFPSDYALPATRHDAIRALGNAVPPPLARWAVDQVSRHLAS